MMSIAAALALAMAALLGFDRSFGASPSSSEASVAEFVRIRAHVRAAAGRLHLTPQLLPHAQLLLYGLLCTCTRSLDNFQQLSS